MTVTTETFSVSDIEEKLNGVQHLISLPEVYLKFRQLMADPYSDISDFATVVSLDTNLSIAVLKAVNSAYFGFPGQVGNVSQAINMLGIEQLHNMIVSITAIATLNLPNDVVPLKTFWRCNLYSGVMARILARKIQLPQHEQLFVMGLLHEVGHLVLYEILPDAYKCIQALVLSEKITVYEAEEKILGCHYGTIGAMLMANWDLPERMQLTTLHQPVPKTAKDYQQEVCVLHIAHAYAQKSVMKCDEPLETMVHPIAWQATGLDPQCVDSEQERAMEVSQEMEHIITV